MVFKFNETNKRKKEFLVKITWIETKVRAGWRKLLRDGDKAEFFRYNTNKYARK